MNSLIAFRVLRCPAVANSLHPFENRYKDDEGRKVTAEADVQPGQREPSMFVRAVRHAYIRRNRQPDFMGQVLAEGWFVGAYAGQVGEGAEPLADTRSAELAPPPDQCGAPTEEPGRLGSH